MSCDRRRNRAAGISQRAERRSNDVAHERSVAKSAHCLTQPRCQHRLSPSIESRRSAIVTVLYFVSHPFFFFRAREGFRLRLPSPPSGPTLAVVSLRSGSRPGCSEPQPRRASGLRWPPFETARLVDVSLDPRGIGGSYQAFHGALPEAHRSSSSRLSRSVSTACQNPSCT